MNPIIMNYLYRINLGQMQQFENMAVIPLFSSIHAGPLYITLKEALDEKVVSVTEINAAGAVPTLKIINDSDLFVLLLDGEELVGARQNRVLNTSMLLRKRSETIIPVSCTEQGRWSYRSAEFVHAEAMMAYGSRLDTAAEVSASLDTGRGYSSNQVRLWGRIAHMHDVASTSSPTGAMRDMYTAKMEELAKLGQPFSWVNRQQGCLVFINGEVAGLDMVSQEAAYRAVHPQLIKSYAMEALLQKSNGKSEIGPEKPIAFLRETLKCQESQFDAIGQGLNYRFAGPQAIGSVLVCHEAVIHLTFFSTAKSDHEEPEAGLSQRRLFRHLLR